MDAKGANTEQALEGCEQARLASEQKLASVQAEVEKVRTAVRDAEDELANRTAAGWLYSVAEEWVGAQLLRTLRKEGFRD